MQNDLNSDKLFVNAVFIFGNAIASSGAGFLFWAVASQLFEAEAIGTSASLLSLAQFLSLIGGLGMVNGLTRFLPQDEQPQELANSAILLSAVSSTAVGLAFATFIALVHLPALQAFRNFQTYLTMVVLLASMAVFASTGGVFIATRKAVYAFVQVAIMNLLRLGLLAPLMYMPEWGVIGAILGGYLITSLVSWLGLVRKVLPGYRVTPRIYWSNIRGVITFALSEQVADFLRQAPQSLSVPIALLFSGGRDSAVLYVVWMIAAFTSGPSLALSRSALVEGIHFPSQTKRTLVRAGSAALIVTAFLALILGVNSSLVLKVFGVEYAMHGTESLRLMMIASPIVALNSILLGFLRVAKCISGLVVSSFIIAIITLLVTVLAIGWLGISSVSYGWILANLITLIYLFVISHRLTHEL